MYVKRKIALLQTWTAVLVRFLPIIDVNTANLDTADVDTPFQYTSPTWFPDIIPRYDYPICLRKRFL